MPTATLSDPLLNSTCSSQNPAHPLGEAHVGPCQPGDTQCSTTDTQGETPSWEQSHESICPWAMPVLYGR